VVRSCFQVCVAGVQRGGRQLPAPDRADVQCHVPFAPPLVLSDVRDLVARTVRAVESRLGPEAPASPVTIHWDGLAVEPTRALAGTLQDIVVAAARRAGVAGVVPGPSAGTSELLHFAPLRSPSAPH